MAKREDSAADPQVRAPVFTQTGQASFPELDDWKQVGEAEARIAYEMTLRNVTCVLETPSEADDARQAAKPAQPDRSPPKIKTVATGSICGYPHADASLRFHASLNSGGNWTGRGWYSIAGLGLAARKGIRSRAGLDTRRTTIQTARPYVQHVPIGAAVADCRYG